MELFSSHNNNQPQERAEPHSPQANSPTQGVEAAAETPGHSPRGSYVSNPFQVIIDSFKKLFTVNFVTFLGIFGIFILTTFLIGFSLALFFMSNGAAGTGPALPGDPLAYVAGAVGAVLFVVWTVILEAAWQKYSIETARGNLLSFVQAMRAGFKKGPGLLVVKIITALLVLIGLILLIIPGLVFWYWFFFATQVYVDKDIGIIASFKESKRLVKGKLVELLGLFGTSLVFALPVMVPLLGILYQIVITPVFWLAWQYRYTSADMLGKTGLSKPPTHVANKVMAIVGIVIVVLILALSMVPYIMVSNFS